jgi:hypothetical protein
MRYMGFFLALAVLLFVASPAQAQQGVGRKARKPKGQPEWVRSTPSDPFYFAGVGTASKALRPNDYKQAALQSALGNMANMIVVYLTSQDTFRRNEVVTGDARKPQTTYGENYVANTATYTRNKLEGYERVGEYDDGNTYWVYIRLNKMKYQQRKQQEFLAAMQSSQELYDSALVSEKARDMYRALLNLSRSLEPVLPYLDRAMEAEYRGPAIQRMNRQYTLLNNWLASIRIDTAKAIPRYRTGQTEPLIIDLKATYTQDGQKVTLNPFPFFLTAPGTSSVLLNDHVVSDANGVAQAEFRTVVPGRNGLALRAVLDTTQFGLFNPTGDYYLRGNTLPIPRRYFNIKTRGPRVQVVTREQNMDKAMRMQRLFPLLKDSLSAHGCEVVSPNAEYDYRIVLDANTRDGGNNSGYFVAIFEGQLTVQDKDGNELLNELLKDIRGRKFDYENAGYIAYDTAAKRIGTEIVPRIVQAVYRPKE